MSRFVWAFLLACGSAGGAGGTPSDTTGGSNAAEPEEPSADEPSDEPVGDAAEGTPDAGTAGTQDETPMQYYIDGEQVDETTFSALHSRLAVEAEAFEGETVENSDGSYGGASESFRARDGDVEYHYTEAVFRGEDGTIVNSRSLRRMP